MIVYLKLSITFVVEKREERDMPADTSRSPPLILYISLQEIEFLSSRNHFFTQPPLPTQPRGQQSTCPEYH